MEKSTPAYGMYVLKEDVKNPRPNRAHTRDWRCSPTWTAGTCFAIVPRPWDRHGLVALVKFGEYPHIFENVEHERAAALLGSLEPSEPKDLEQVIQFSRARHRDVGAYSVLQHMLDTGRLTLADISAMEEEIYQIEHAERQESIRKVDEEPAAGRPPA